MGLTLMGVFPLLWSLFCTNVEWAHNGVSHKLCGFNLGTHQYLASLAGYFSVETPLHAQPSPVLIVGLFGELSRVWCCSRDHSASAWSYVSLISTPLASKSGQAPLMSVTLDFRVGYVRMAPSVSRLDQLGTAFWKSPDGRSLEYLSLYRFLLIKYLLEPQL